jgi:hypothetical protein
VRIVLNLEANISNCHIFIRGRGHSSVEGQGCGVSALTEDSVIGHDCRFETVNLSSSRTALGPARRQQVRHFLQTLCPTWPTHYKPAADSGRCKTVQNVNWSLHRSGPYCLQEGKPELAAKVAEEQEAEQREYQTLTAKPNRSAAVSRTVSLAVQRLCSGGRAAAGAPAARAVLLQICDCQCSNASSPHAHPMSLTVRHAAPRLNQRHVPGSRFVRSDPLPPTQCPSVSGATPCGLASWRKWRT